MRRRGRTRLDANPVVGLEFAQGLDPPGVGLAVKSAVSPVPRVLGVDAHVPNVSRTDEEGPGDLIEIAHRASSCPCSRAHRRSTPRFAGAVPRTAAVDVVERQSALFVDVRVVALQVAVADAALEIGLRERLDGPPDGSGEALDVLFERPAR